MRSLGLDIGDKRTGVAISDPQGILATPLTVLANKSEDATIDDIIRFAEQYEVERIVVGLPRCLSGDLGEQANKVTAFTERLRNVIASRSNVIASEAKQPRSEGATKQSRLSGVDIQLWDERFSTVAVDKLMVKTGTKRNRRKQQRDAMAAAFILQGFLDSLSDSSSSDHS